MHVHERGLAAVVGEDIRNTIDQGPAASHGPMTDDPAERVSWVRPANFAGWEYLIARQSSHLWTIYHETYTLCACANDGEHWWYRGRMHDMRSPGIMMMEPGELHRTVAVPPVCHFKVAIIPPNQVETAAAEAGLRRAPHLRVAQAEDPILARLIFHLGCIAEGEATTALEVQSLQASMIHRLLGHGEQAPRASAGCFKPRCLARVKDYLNENIDFDVSLDELSRIGGVSRYWLVRNFRRAYGMPPHAFHLQMRVVRARALLRQGMTGVQVAAKLGFTDQAHFIRHFKRIMYATPGDYARGDMLPGPQRGSAV